MPRVGGAPNFVVINDVIIILKAHDRMFLAGDGRPSSAECGERDGRE